MKFVGRRKELEKLRQFQGKRSASLIVIRGRRRIGKSRLIEEFSQEFSQAYTFSGIPPEDKVTEEQQRESFALQMSQQRIPRFRGNDWSDLFFELAEHCKKGPVLLALDEITWMGSKDPTFLGKLKTAWDLHFKKNPKLILILSGSDSTWIKKNILSSTGFVGRIAYRMKLDELPLHQCTKFFRPMSEGSSSYEIFKVLSVTGGVPRYLEELHPKLTAEENIRQLCFDPGGLLFNEFDQTFASLFSRRFTTYKQIMIALDQGALSIADVATFLKRSAGGDLSEYLDDLCEAGFVAKYHPWEIKSAKPIKRNHYRIKDSYTRFYLRFVEPIRKQIENQAVSQLPAGWHSILGLQFESLVVNHSKEIHQLLGINEAEVSANGPYLQSKTLRKPGCQVDYLVQTKYDTVYLCEVKFSRQSLGTGLIDEVQEKVRRLHRPKGTSIRPVLIHVNGVSDELLARDYFAHIIDFAELLES